MNDLLKRKTIVAKFGGAILKEPESIKKMSKIIQDEYKDSNLIIVVSAFDKTTNTIEELLEISRKNVPFEENFEAETKLHKIANYHFDIISKLIKKEWCLDIASERVEEILEALMYELSHTKKDYNYVYDQTVSLGEELSSTIIHHFLLNCEIKNEFLDARSVIFTDNNYRQANVDIEKSKITSRDVILKLLKQNQRIVTQGFIGFTREISDKNLFHTTTLGREGSDYSAALFARIIDADRVDLWKNVDGIYTSDPNKRDQKATLIDKIDFAQLENLALILGKDENGKDNFKIVHPKTFGILKGNEFNKPIPLYVRSYNNPDKGTMVCEPEEYKNQTIVELQKSEN